MPPSLGPPPASTGSSPGRRRVAWVRTQTARGCDKPWIEIRPRGWICGDYVEPSRKPPFGQEVPHLDRGELVPGIYGKVTAPASNDRPVRVIEDIVIPPTATARLHPL